LRNSDCTNKELVEAVRLGDKALAEEILTANPLAIHSLDLRQVYRDRTLVHWAVANNDRPMLEMLLRHGGKLDEVD
jgi:ankyrin repeat protein